MASNPSENIDSVFKEDHGRTSFKKKPEDADKGNPKWIKKKSTFLHKLADHDPKKLPEDTTTDATSASTTTTKRPQPSFLLGEEGGLNDEEVSKSALLAGVFRPFSAVLACSGFFPYYLVEEEDSYFQVKFDKKSLRSIGFHAAFLSYLVIYLVTFIGFIIVYNELPCMAQTTPYIINATDAFQQLVTGRWETIMISNCWVMIIVIWSWMTMGVIGAFHTYYYAADYGHYHSYWHKTLTMLDIDPTDYVRQFLIKEAIQFGVMFVVLLIIFGVTASFRISCGLIGCFFFGMFANDLPEHSAFVIVQLVGFLIVFYGYAGTRACLVQFIFYCRLLTNTAKIWNYRFESVLVGALFRDVLTPTQKMFAQYRILLKDHFLVVQLYKLTEGCFGGLLQFYYLLQSTCLTLMALYLYFNLSARKVTIFSYKNYSYEKYDFYMPTYVAVPVTPSDEVELGIQAIQRALHTMIYIFLFLQCMFMSFHVTAWAQIALDEGMDGFNVLRKHGLVMCTNRSERNLIHSLTISFARNNPLAITADGYFTVDKQLFLCIIAMVVNYVTMLVQYNFEEYLVSSVDFRLEWGPPTGTKILLKVLPE